MREVAIDGERWRELLSDSADATPFHHPAWSLLLAEAYGFRPFALIQEDEDGRAVAGLPMMEVSLPLRRPRWVSLPFTDFCSPLTLHRELSDDFSTELDLLRTRGGIDRLEVRAPLPPAGAAQLSSSAFRHVLRLGTNDEEVLQNVRYPQVRRSVKKAIREGVVVRPGESKRDLVDVFYKLHVMTRRRLGVPVQPRRYFELLWSRMLEPGLGRLFLGYSNGTPIAGAIVLLWKSWAIYKYSASDERAKKLRPNNLLVWTALQWSIEQRVTLFDFGRTDADHEGLRTFKKGWGAHEEALTYSTLGEASGTTAQSMPALVSYAIRHSPQLLCRALGEGFYRFAA